MPSSLPFYCPQLTTKHFVLFTSSPLAKPIKIFSINSMPEMHKTSKRKVIFRVSYVKWSRLIVFETKSPGFKLRETLDESQPSLLKLKQHDCVVTTLRLNGSKHFLLFFFSSSEFLFIWPFASGWLVAETFRFKWGVGCFVRPPDSHRFS